MGFTWWDETDGTMGRCSPHVPATRTGFLYESLGYRIVDRRPRYRKLF